MNLTVPEIKAKLKLLDEISILELLQIEAEDLVERFSDIIEDNADYLEEELNGTDDE